MSTYLRFLLMTACLVLTNCGMVRISTSNFPIFYDHSVELINASDCYLEVAINGKRCHHRRDGQEQLLLAPGKTTALWFNNYSTQQGAATVSVKGWTRPDGGALKGAASRTIYVSNYSQQAQTWIVNQDNLQRGTSW